MFWQKKLNFFLKSRQNAVSIPPLPVAALDESAIAAALLPRLTAGAKTLIITPQLDVAEEIARQISILVRSFDLSCRTLLLPEALRGKLYISGGEAERARVLNLAAAGEFDLLIASAAAALAPAPAPEQLAASEITLAIGDRVPFTGLLEKLVKLDYDDEFEVSSPGEFARRGGIIDIFSPAENAPGRIEFFGDEIESIRAFDPETQRATEPLKTYRVVNRCTLAAQTDGDESGDDALPSADLLDYAAAAGWHCFRIFPERLEDYFERFGGAEGAARFEAFYAKLAPTLRRDFRGEDSAPGVSEPALVYPATAHLARELDDEVRRKGVELIDRQFALQIEQWLATGYEVVFTANDPEGVPNLEEWRRAELGDQVAKIPIVPLLFPASLLFPELKLVILTENDIFSGGRGAVKYVKPEDAHQLPSETPTFENTVVADLDESDYVVHLAHGIGIFRGLKNSTQNGVTREVMVLEYADGALLHVPLYQAGSVSRYVGGGAAGTVKLHRLGGVKWKNDKLDAMRSVRHYAADMLRLQAVRATSPGLQLPAPGRPEKGFAANFGFVPTADQLRSIAEIDADLDSGKPMDRLLAGDVGYGKTELAMRAAFRLVNAGYQVVLMAPTTVLAQQHFYSFTERFAPYAFNIEMLSRFRSNSEQKEIIARLAAGTVDIVIGTHRLAQPDLRFANLGLVIVDEEQRFGVQVKDRLLKLRADVNMLTMSATPIPRTLYLSMAGARNLSTIMTAPSLRLPVKTFVLRADDQILAEAIREEIARGGQVYFLHNRVKTIADRMHELQRLCPDVTFGIAHGQLEEEELENAMSRFLTGKIQVLVCTTIIESGLDVPNANTIIIERADRFGLAELYQLRGRVGRWKHQAYAYMVVPTHELITPDGRKRIAAIRRYTHLGAGLRLALRDLEIRGAGNVLGAEQSGHISAVGFELYCQLLTHEIAELKNQPREWIPEVDMAVEFVQFAHITPPGVLPAALPPEYIEAERLRIEAYRKLSRLSSEAMVADFRAELVDRYGKLPRMAETLLTVVLLKIFAAQAGYSSLSVIDDRVYLRNRSSDSYRIGGKIPSLSWRKPPEVRLQELLGIARMATLDSPLRRRGN